LSLLKKLTCYIPSSTGTPKHLSFPKKGLKYFLKFLKLTGNSDKIFHKKLHNGLLFQVNPKEHVQKDIFWYGFYEKKYVLAWELLIQSDFSVADIGANAGYYSLVASKK
jgi:hypothetical protein